MIVGAGAVKNAWEPIINVVKEYFDFEVDSDCANSFFARLVYLMRFYATSPTDESDELLKELTNEGNDIKKKICEELKKAQETKTISAREELESILDKFIFSEKNNRVILISTNWDTVIQTELNKLGQHESEPEVSDIIANHIHGSIDDHPGLYLPSDVANEAYRAKEQEQYIGQIHGDTFRAIEESNISIIYGLSLDPLDAELCQTLASGWSSPNMREVIILNPDHEKIAKRVKLLMNQQNKFKISAYSPDNLSKKFTY